MSDATARALREKKLVLVVDDSRIARKVMTKKLTALGLDPVEAGGGIEGVKLYKELQPDLVFMDLTMPDLLGFDALEQIKEYDPNARVIIVSADIQQKARERCEQAGALAILPKPFDDQHILEYLK